MAVLNIDRRGLLSRVAALAVALSAARALARPAAGESPLAFVSAIYRRAVKEGAGNFVWSEAADRPRFMTKSLVALFAKTDAATLEGDEGPGGFDYVTDTNGLTIASFKAALERQEGPKAVVAVTLGYKEKDVSRKKPVVLRYDLVVEDGQWKVDDIREEDWALRKLPTDFVVTQKKE